MMDIHTINIGEHFTHALITHISSSDWIRASEKQFSCGIKDEVAEAGKRTKFLQLGFMDEIFCSQGFWASLTSVDFGQRMVRLSWNFVESSIFEGRTHWHKNRGQKVDRSWSCIGFIVAALRWLFLDCIDFYGVDFELTGWLIWGFLWHILGWPTKNTLLVEASCWPP